MANCVHFLRLGGLIFTCHMIKCAFIWWPILYIYLLLVNYSVHQKLFDGIFYTHTSQHCPIFYVQPLHDLVCIVLAFVAYFVYFLLGELRDILWLHLHVTLVTYSVHNEFLYTYFPMFDLFSISTTSSLPNLYNLTFMVYFVYLLLLGELIFTWEIFNIYTCMYLWWPILCTYLFLVTYSVLKEPPHVDLNSRSKT